MFNLFPGTKDYAGFAMQQKQYEKSMRDAKLERELQRQREEALRDSLQTRMAVDEARKSLPMSGWVARRTPENLHKPMGAEIVGGIPGMEGDQPQLQMGGGGGGKRPGNPEIDEETVRQLREKRLLDAARGPQMTDLEKMQAMQSFDADQKEKDRVSREKIAAARSGGKKVTPSEAATIAKGEAAKKFPADPNDIMGVLGAGADRERKLYADQIAADILAGKQSAGNQPVYPDNYVETPQTYEDVKGAQAKAVKKMQTAAQRKAEYEKQVIQDPSGKVMNPQLTEKQSEIVKKYDEKGIEMGDEEWNALLGFDDSTADEILMGFGDE